MGFATARAQWDSIGYVEPNVYFTSPLVAYEFVNTVGGTPSNPWSYGCFYKSVNGEGTLLAQVGGEFPGTFGSVLSFRFLTNDTGFAAYNYMNMTSVLTSTTDGGSSWNPIWGHSGYNVVYSFLRSDYGYYFMLGVPASDTTRGLTLYNQDSYSIQDTTFFPDVKSILFINDSTGFAFCGSISYALFRTFDFGHTWSAPNYPNNKLKKICFPNQSTGFILDTANYLYSSSDLGATWNPIGLIPMEDVLDIFFLTSDIGWAAGTHGIVLKTLTGGNQWETVLTPTTHDIIQIRFFTPDIGYFVTNYCQYFNYCFSQLYRTTAGPWGVSEIEPARPLRIIQNPVSTKLRLTTSNPTEWITNIEIISSPGQVVYHSDNYSPEINVSSFRNGIYLYKYDYQGKTFTEKFIINVH